ncbi:hypothetical protein LY625_06820 [Lysobacter sp. GX 14042]|uniref:hypothetical protein n=1 Tax=Lysobacter sp. GX 14042 TaxID=2907155 RepID=UPI001F228DDA|nr:hypothetical protein [Lysobacter sp. GX 14042]MCE7032334.1 hypothetical protein [Lysobacter sp. GX 14042]
MSSQARLRSGALIVSVSLLALAPLLAQASGARHSDKARHGEIVVLRDVHARHAYRSMPPGMAVIVDPSPRTELERVLGTGELTDAEFAALGASTGAGPVAGPTTVERMTRHAVGGSLDVLTGNSGPLSGASLSGSVSVPIGAVHRATGGIADQINGALAQFPLMGQASQSTTPPGGP